MKNLMENSTSFVFDLYRCKLRAEKRSDAEAINNLRTHYPELFTEEFQLFIELTKHAAEQLGNKYGEDFTKLFDVDT